MNVRSVSLALMIAAITIFSDSLIGQDVRELVALTRDREQVLSKWTVDVEVTRRDQRKPEQTAVPRTDGVPNNGQLPDWITFRSTEKIVYSHPNWYVDVRTSNDIEVKDARDRRAFDGSVVSSMRGDLSKWSLGKISTRPSLPSESLEYFLGLYNLPYSEAIQSIATSTSSVNGRICIKSPVRDNKTGTRNIHQKAELFFDVASGYAPVRLHEFSKLQESEDWQLVKYWEVLEFHQDSSGVFLPKLVEIKECLFGANSSDPGLTPPELFSEARIEFRNWSVGNAPESTSFEKFRVAFPANVSVEDERVGKSFQAVELTDWAILDEAEKVEGFSPGRQFSLFLIVVLGLVFGGWYIYRMRTLKK
jgi:hypothetical protein